MKFFSSNKRQTKQDRDLHSSSSRDEQGLPPSYTASTSPSSPPTANKPAAKKSVSTSSPAPLPKSYSNPTNDKKRSSRSYTRHSSDLGKSSSHRSKRKEKIDPDTHPLNLHPDEIRRLSALSAMSSRDSVDRMDVDSPNTSAPSSPSQRMQSPPPQSEAAAAAAAAAEPTPVQTPPPATNGSSSPIKTEDAPPIPPHTSDPHSPPPTPSDEAEIFKALGNKFFKEKNYKRAIEEYTKGMLPACH